MRLKFPACLLLLSFLFFNSPLLCAKELEREARVIFVKGDAKVQKAGKAEWLSAKKGMLLADGDTARTGKEAAIEISFDNENKNLVRLEEDSTLILRGKMLKQIELPQGRIRSLVKKLDKETSFEIKTPTIIAGARGSGWDVSTAEKRDNVRAFEDEIFVQAYGQDGKLIKEVLVREGWEVIIDRFQAPGELIELSDKDRQDWNSWRDDLNDRLQAGGAKEDSKPGEFNDIQQIERMTESRDDFKQDLLETEDIKKIDDRIQGESADPVHGGAGGGAVHY
ncbi:MAG: FecR family protein [Candidatus Omnitrophica bacterium]|nr:FecR family protein [Candidatus Omnitrophota bacterium]